MISEDDRGILLGDGLFDTLRVEQGRPLLFARHLARLHRACEVFGYGLSSEAIRVAMEEGLEGLKGQTGSLRTTVTRGSGERGLMPPERPHPTLFTRTSPAAPRTYGAATAIIAKTRRNEGSPSTNHKTLGYLDNILARQEAAEAGADEAIMLTNGGHVACTTIGNLLVLRKDAPCLTSPRADGVLPGVVRQVLIEKGLVEERRLTPEDIENQPLARTNSLLGATPLLLQNRPPQPGWASGALSRLTEALEEAEATEP